MNSFSLQDGSLIAERLVQTITSNKAYLSEVDGLIGDGDHGINMSKGFSMFGEKIAQGAPMLDECFVQLGDILLNEIGGSMGPIYGCFFIEMGDSLHGREAVDAPAFATMLQAGLAGIRALVASDVGDKTLLDCLIPAINAFEQSIREGAPFAEALHATKAAAEQGKESTIDLVAKFGRASRLGERSRGVLDAGATSCNLIIQCMCDTALELMGDV